MLKRGNPGQLLDELHAGALQVKAGVERDRHQEARQGAHERDRALQRGLAVVALIGTDGQHQQAGEDRHPDREAEEHQLGVLT